MLYCKASAVFGIASLSFLVFSTPANSACSTDTGSEWECIEVWDGAQYQDRTDLGLQGVGGSKGTPGVNPFTFEGNVALSHWAFGTLNCTWTAGLYIGVDSSGQADIEVSEFVLGGSPTCSDQSVGLPLTFTLLDPNDIDDRDWGSTATTSNELFSLHWTQLGGQPLCEGYLLIELGNDVLHLAREEPSYIEVVDQSMSGFLGDCIILDGTLTTDGYTDINLW